MQASAFQIYKMYPEFQVIDEILVLSLKALDIVEDIFLQIKSRPKVRTLLLHAGEEYFNNSNYSFSLTNTQRIKNKIFTNLQSMNSDIQSKLQTYFRILTMIDKSLHSAKKGILYYPSDGNFLLVDKDLDLGEQKDKEWIQFTDAYVYSNPLYIFRIYESLEKQYPQIREFQETRRQAANQMSRKPISPMSPMPPMSSISDINEEPEESSLFLPLSRSTTDSSNPRPSSPDLEGGSRYTKKRKSRARKLKRMHKKTKKHRSSR